MSIFLIEASLASAVVLTLPGADGALAAIIETALEKADEPIELSALTWNI